MNLNIKAAQTTGLRSRTTQLFFVKFVVLLTLALAGPAILSCAAQSSVLQGTVSVNSGEGQAERLPGASMILTPATPGQTTRSAVTNDHAKLKELRN